MPFARRKVTVDGVEQFQKVEGPKAPNKLGQMVFPVAFLEASGATYVRDDFKPGQKRPLGVDGQGHEFVSDQRWIYDADEAQQLQAQFPDRLVLCEEDPR